MSKAKKKSPPTVRGKRDNQGEAPIALLNEAEKYLSAQAVSPLGPQVAPEAAVLKTTHDTLATKVGEDKALRASLELKSSEVSLAEKALGNASSDYVRKASRVSSGDPAALIGLGVVPAAAPVPPGVAGVPTVTLKEGVSQGEATVRMTRPPRTGSFVVQYKLEPSLPTDPWLPPLGIQTSRATYTVTGLAPSQGLRVRAQAVGAAPGPWSTEVIGKAR